MTGPNLKGVEERWAAFPDQLYRWIRNNQELINDPSSKAYNYANKVFNDWNKANMNAFPNLSDADIDDILLFVNNQAAFGCASPPCADVQDPKTESKTAQTTDGAGSTILWVLAFVLALATIVLARYINNLNRLAALKTQGEHVEEKSLMEIILNPTLVRLVIFALVLLGGYTTINNAVGLGRQQNYEPAQPIKFSHELHAGKHEIDCQYCHDGARRSKHGVIPATNTCMNCHTAVQNGPEHGTAEILKIYASSGFNPIANKTPKHGQYFHDTVSVETRLEVYAEWLKEANKENAAIGEREINAQLAAARSLVGKTIEWVRIHNLSDHVYFNHAQHVVAGKVACQDCHGPVEEMKVVKQYSPLSMGWCINCHRQTKIQFNENGYYKSDDYKMYEQYHNEVSNGKRNGVTVEEIGGLECQKCHY